MAFATGGKGGAQSDINVTPLVDVVLVLLIIFMVVTPLLQVSLEAEIPKDDQTEPPPPPNPNDPIQVVISVKRDGTYLNLDKVDDEQLATRLESMMKGREKSKRIAFITGEDGLPFGSIVHVMDIARGAKVENVGIIDPL
jgi:biopolymer transport protein TolR